MLILTMRTDKPEAEIGLFNGQDKLDYIVWQAHRELAETIHLKIKELLGKNKKELADIEGIVIYQGPGSFTGLRIGFSVANSLATALEINITAAAGDTWIHKGIEHLLAGSGQARALPDYGADPHVTKPRK